MKTNQEIGKKVCAIAILVAMMVCNFFIVGKEAVSYALDTIKTNSDNVKFTAYFLNENGEKVSQTEKTILEGEETLYVEIEVKNEGYFNGELSLDSSNIEIDRNHVSELIQEISENGEVKLKQINAGTKAVVELKVKAKQEAEITTKNLQFASKVILSGEYANSKNIEKNKLISIKGETKIELDWISVDEAELSLEVLTNKIYKIENEDKRVVQALVTSRIKDNNYPVKRTILEIEGLIGAEKVEVEARSVKATNKNIEFKDNNYTYNKETGKIEITLENVNPEQIDWEKDARDEFLVTYTFGAGTEVEEKTIKVTGNIETYDEKEVTTVVTGIVGEEKDGTVSYGIETEKEVYKGKIQIGEEKEYKTQVNLNINYLNGEGKIELTQVGMYGVGDAELAGKITYKETKINKENFLKLFGKEGYVTLKDENGITVGNINKDSQTDEEGNVVIKYGEGVRKVTIQTSEPIDVGTLKIENVKSIKNIEYTREQINEITSINEKVIGKYNENLIKQAKAQIELKNTSTEATLEVSAEELTTLEKNENVKMTVTLLNNDESKDLYKNPNIKIKMPRQVKGIEAKCKLLYGNGLNLGERKITQEDGRYVIEIKLDGEQTEYNTEAVEGTKLVIYADLELYEKEANSEEKIELEYTNEKATSYKDEGREEVGIGIESRAGVIVANGIAEYGVETIGDEGNKEVNVGIEEGAKEATVKIEAINNEGSKIGDVRILGHFPTKEEDTLGVELISGIETEQEGVKIYYSNEESPTEDLEDESNGWSEQRDRYTAKSYLIVMDDIQDRGKFEANYKIAMPNDIKYSTRASEDYSISYTNLLTLEKNTVNATELEMVTEEKSKVKLDVKAIVGNDEVGTGLDTQAETGDQVASGEIITYEVIVTNESEEEVTGLKLEEIVPNNAMALRYEEQEYQGIGICKLVDTEDTIISQDLDKLGAKETKIINLYLRSKYTEDTTKLINIIKLCSNDDDIATKYVTNEISSSKIKVSLGYSLTDEDGIIGVNEQCYRLLEIQNISQTKIDDLKINFIADDFINVNSWINYETTEGTINGVRNFEELEKISLEPQKKLIIFFGVMAEDVGLTEDFVVVNEGNDTIRSNRLSQRVRTFDLNLDLESPNVGEEIRPGQEIDYTIKIKNKDTSIKIDTDIESTISPLLELKQVEVDGKLLKEEDYLIDADDNSNQILIISNKLSIGETKQIQIRTKVNDDALDFITEDFDIINNAVAKINGEIVATTEDITHTLKAIDDSDEVNNQDEDLALPYNPDELSDSDNMDNSNNSNNSENPNDSDNLDNPEENNQPSKETYSISGTVWKDENKDGRKDSSEDRINGIHVILVDANRATSKAQTTTNENGMYKFNDVEKGKYIVVFDYDTENYIPTTYQADIASDSINSDAITSEITIDGEEKAATITDTVDLQENKTNIDLGLIDASIFDLSLTKTINKVTVITSQGTKISNYDGKDLVKTEINSKYLAGSTVIVEYKIKVTNEGEISGYVKSIVDYKPTDLNFDSSLNKGWYMSNGNLYYSGLANTKIESGDTKEIMLTLTKTMTNLNTGLVNNMAEIAEDYNTLGLKDKDSTAGNKQKSEDDLSSANLIINVKTGAAINYILLTISILILLIGIAYLFNKTILKVKIKF